MANKDISYVLDQAKAYMQAAHDTPKEPWVSAIIGGLNAVYIVQEELLKQVVALRHEIDDMKSGNDA